MESADSSVGVSCKNTAYQNQSLKDFESIDAHFCAVLCFV